MHNTTDVFNLCHAVECGSHRNSKLGWRTPRPKAHWLQPFVLLVGPEHVLLRLRTQTTWILLNAKLRAQHLKVIAHSLLKLLLFQKLNNQQKYLPAVCSLYSVPFSGKAVPVSHYRVCPNVVVCVINTQCPVLRTAESLTVTSL